MHSLYSPLRDLIPYRWRAMLYLSMLCSALGACDDLPEPGHELDSGYAFFGIAVDPPMPRPEDTITLRAFDKSLYPERVVYQWSICLRHLGPEQDFRCEEEQLRVILPDALPQIQVDLSDSGLKLRERYRSEVKSRERGLPGFAEGVEVLIRLRSGESSARLRETIKRVVISDEPPAHENPLPLSWSLRESEVGNPKPVCYAEIGVQGEVLRPLDESQAVAGEPEDACPVHAGARLELCLNFSALEEGERVSKNCLQTTPRGERPVHSWYGSEGFTGSTPLSFGEGSRGVLYAPNRSGPGKIWAALRDDRGGFHLVMLPLQLIPTALSGSAPTP